jgi:hypothetical protein
MPEPKSWRRYSCLSRRASSRRFFRPRQRLGPRRELAHPISSEAPICPDHFKEYGAYCRPTMQACLHHDPLAVRVLAAYFWNKINKLRNYPINSAKPYGKLKSDRLLFDSGSPVVTHRQRALDFIREREKAPASPLLRRRRKRETGSGRASCGRSRGIFWRHSLTSSIESTLRSLTQTSPAVMRDFPQSMPVLCCLFRGQ